MSSDNINKIIKKLCKEIFPKDVFQKGNSRIYIDDNGYYLTVIEFQPITLKKGAFLNAGVDFLFDKLDFLGCMYAFNGDGRIGNKFIEYINDEQFENEIREYVELANDYILRYRAFCDIEYAKQCMLNELDDKNWNPYVKSMFYYLTDDTENGNKYYEIWSNEEFFKRIIKKYNYPENSSELSKEYVMNLIRDERAFWHSKAYMKKMKTYEAYER